MQPNLRYLFIATLWLLLNHSAYTVAQKDSTTLRKLPQCTISCAVTAAEAVNCDRYVFFFFFFHIYNQASRYDSFTFSYQERCSMPLLSWNIYQCYSWLCIRDLWSGWSGFNAGNSNRNMFFWYFFFFIYNLPHLLSLTAIWRTETGLKCLVLPSPMLPRLIVYIVSTYTIHKIYMIFNTSSSFPSKVHTSVTIQIFSV